MDMRAPPNASARPRLVYTQAHARHSRGLARPPSSTHTVAPPPRQPCPNIPRFHNDSKASFRLGRGSWPPRVQDLSGLPDK
ncbi:BZ3500_MvSof-1268-A1-R1_Chr1-1g00880 [Microbotryum saponariae]|uniref:BZ3500_MvSof-1268-A1-R1_Chr1-1g00880 protein n=1 Tax=Microbotryum saponariae TaxID=289078 RepID=A0A2X0MFB8_9BASI|nr:BZ3500_MvSof-1268-A1-R1_Chr1-1g00880 [Microbotryum saponariae]SCZ92840.1 BZ3501_MvSof-1269-A2-R1_Chr1-1g00477 [Microbotryum saponariae]